MNFCKVKVRLIEVLYLNLKYITLFVLNLKEAYEKQLQEAEDEIERYVNEISNLDKNSEKMRQENSELKSKVSILIRSYKKIKTTKRKYKNDWNSKFS